MEINGQVVKVEQLMQNLQQSSLSTSDNSLSVYTGQLTPLCVIDNVKRLKLAFPQLPQGFYDILGEMVKDDGFCDSRLTDAVKNVIKTCVYPTPTIANILSFDKRVKLHTHEEMCDMAIRSGISIWSAYDQKRINGRVYWISKAEKEQYGL